MIEAPIKIVNRWEFEHMNLDDYPFAISIRDPDENIPRPNYNGERLNLAFYDHVEGPNIATVDDIGAVRSFTERWMPEENANEPLGNLIIHCFAGVSRSSAIALVPLLVYYQLRVSDYELAAARRLFDVNRWADPNTHVIYLIEESFGLDGSLFTALEEAKVDKFHLAVRL